MIPVVYVVVVCLFAISKAADGAIGMNWGRQSAQRLIPSTVVDLLLQNGVPEARVYTSQEDIMQAFAGSGIGLTLSVFHINQITTYDEAKAWVQEKLPYFSSANIRRVYLGNYVFDKGLTDKTFLDSAIKTLEFMQNALNDAGYGDQIKATLPNAYTIIKDNITRPSEAEFRDEIKEEMNRTIRFLQENNAPFVLEMFPIQYVSENNLDPSFAFPDNKSTYVVRDINGALYTNVFEFMYDAFVWALQKTGAPDLKIVVGQVGWPTDGYPGANSSTAERFYKSLLPLVASNKGTPMRPGAPIDTYVHCLTDEHSMPYNYPFARHWGIYRSNGEPKYKIDLTGQGRNIFPSRAKGIMRMPDRWCVFNGNVTDMPRVKRLYGEACLKADCTSLAPGGSCSQLSFAQNVSYAFNMLFQSKFQDEDACKFEKLGQVVLENPSTDGCVFPVEVVKGQQVDFETLEYTEQEIQIVVRATNCIAFSLTRTITKEVKINILQVLIEV
ncbi:hypothetical protein Pfo_029726 [Paulownia fortunei]|nr:hypothetical protein Pfo_029726 [Paulownia fortunei]